MSEHAEFIQNYEKYKDKIYTFIMYRVNFNRAIAEDLSSEIFIKAFKNFEGFDRDKPFGAWIYAIARNHLANHYRSQKFDTDLEKAVNLSVDMRRQMEINSELEEVMEKIQRLDSYSKDVLLLRYVDGLENNEIAEILGKDEGTIRTQLSRALKKLRELI
jgi:RNA polymerase sigma factor (sigma-70 family)